MESRGGGLTSNSLVAEERSGGGEEEKESSGGGGRGVAPMWRFCLGLGGASGVRRSIGARAGVFSEAESESSTSLQQEGGRLS